MTATEYRERCREAHSQNECPRDPETVGEYRQAIKQATRIYCIPRFGTSERKVRISKTDALWMLDGYLNTHTPRDLEAYDGLTFGSWSPRTKTEFVIG